MLLNNLYVISVIVCFLSGGVSAEYSGSPNQPPPFSWTGKNVSLVFLGDGIPIAQDVDGKKCLQTADNSINRHLYFDVNDDYVFDCDDQAIVELEYDSTVTDPFYMVYDSNYLDGQHQGVFHMHGSAVQPDKTVRWAKHTFTLPRAKFANRQHRRADFRLVAPNGMVRISDIKVRVEGVEKAKDRQGELKLRIVDEASGKAVPARVGIYDEKGRFKPPAADGNAVPINVFYRTLGMYDCRGDTTWPVKNTYAFWTYGEYECSLPAGKYQLIVRKGLEYYLVNEWFTVEPGKTTEHTVQLKRWINMPQKGWYAGDCHCHIGRTREQNPAVLAQCEGEDLNISNLSQMGDIKDYYFRQYAFGKAGRYGRDNYRLIPGQEDPRTPHRGHTLFLNLQQMVRDDDTYYLYHKAFQQVHQAGGLVGYAHKGIGFKADRGMALDVPFGIVDFVEVLQANNMDTRIYYEFLNLGYKLAPTAGSDYPYLDPPGLVRNYVYTGRPFDDQAWFDALKKGYTFVTSGPMLSFTVNDVPMGGQVQVRRGEQLTIQAEASINPTLGKLKELQLIVHGENIYTRKLQPGKTSITLLSTMAADHSMWMAVKAVCEGKLLGHTAPIYITVDGKRTWKRDAVTDLVARQRKRMKEMLATQPKPIVEHWVAEKLKRQWAKQKDLLVQRVKAANVKYDKLLDMLNSD